MEQQAAIAEMISNLRAELAPLGIGVDLLDELELALRARDDEVERTAALLSRHRQILERLGDIVLATASRELATRLLDCLQHLVGAERGFLAACASLEAEWEFLAARHVERADLDAPDSEVSTAIIRRALETGEPAVVADARASDLAVRASVQKLDLRSVVCFPLVHDGQTLGFIYLDDRTRAAAFDETTLEVIAAFLPVASRCLERVLTREQGEQAGLPGVVTRSPQLQEQLRTLRRVASVSAPVLLVGETGTGKSLIARQLHAASDRGDEPFVHLNCGAIPEHLLESELFGTEGGAFTGAEQREGHFLAAGRGTLFFDELQALPEACQVKLLVALQERHVIPLGGREPRPVHCRVVAAMNRPPQEARAAGELREDLYYRLALIVVHLPPLRDRVEDLPVLAEHLLHRIAARLERREVPFLSDAALEQLTAHAWPGNIRELENVLERAVLMNSGLEVSSVSFEEQLRSAPEPQRVDDERFKQLWEELSGDTAALARHLGVHRTSIWRRRKRLGL